VSPSQEAQGERDTSHNVDRICCILDCKLRISGRHLTSVSKLLYYAHRVFAVGEFQKTIRSLVSDFDVGDVSIDVTDYLPDGRELRPKASIEALESMCDAAEHSIHVYGHGKERFSMIFAGENDTYRLFLLAPNGQLLHNVLERLEQELKLEAPPDPAEEVDQIALSIKKLANETIRPLLKRLDSLEEKVLHGSRRLRCFLSFRFSNTNELLALRVQQFLAALDVEVLTGASYEPRQVSENAS
jgi:hypothetical protein